MYCKDGLNRINNPNYSGNKSSKHMCITQCVIIEPLNDKSMLIIMTIWLYLLELIYREQNYTTNMNIELLFVTSKKKRCKLKGIPS